LKLTQNFHKFVEARPEGTTLNFNQISVPQEKDSTFFLFHRLPV